jgi:hypothetical protein
VLYLCSTQAHSGLPRCTSSTSRLFSPSFSFRSLPWHFFRSLRYRPLFYSEFLSLLCHFIIFTQLSICCSYLLEDSTLALPRNSVSPQVVPKIFSFVIGGINKIQVSPFKFLF